MDRWLAFLDLAVGVTLVACALMMVAPPAMRALLAVVGAVWLLETLAPSLVGVHRTVLAWCLLAVPSGRLDGRVRWGLAVAALGLAFGVVPQGAVGVFFMVIAVVLVARADRELVWVAAVAALIVGLSMAFSWLVRSVDAASFDPRAHLLGYNLAVLVTGILLCAATRFRPPRSRGFADHLLAAETSGGLVSLAGLLRETLRDPDIEIGPPGAGVGERRNVVTVEVYDGESVVAELRHRRGSVPDERTLRSVEEAIRLAAARAQHVEELEAKGLELQAAANRLAPAAARRRNDVSGRLNDEVLSRVDEAVAAVDSALGREGVPDAGRAALIIARDELRATKQDVRLIVEDGRRPGAARLPTALHGLAVLSGTIAVDADPAAVAEADSETALYYVASEAVTNALKHAGARRIDVTLRRAGDDVLLSVADDGRGGADSAMPGLAGLRRRVEACGGRLEMVSPSGAGTTITARAPVRRSSPTPR